EADGARGRPLKAPAAHEPVVPVFASLAVVVAGMNGLGKPLDEAWVHRPERFAALTGLRMGQKISSGALAQALTHPEGGLKGIPPGTRRVALLNQADTTLRQSQAASLAKRLLEAYESVVIASCEVGEVHAVHERVAGILLAAGGSTRFGQPKQLLTYRGQPFVRRIAQTALQAGLSPLVVVTGAHAARVEDALAPLPVNIVHNPAWRSGQASSIRVGLETVLAGHPVGAAIFLLADQPQVSLPLLRSLVEEHARTLSPVVAPLVRGRRATPVLFDRVTFPALLALQGDRGGRATFSTYPPAYLPWHDETLLLDVDTPEDYDRLLRLG
ncbi:MAG: putative selenium-dependent hydroxylase accessory protein YqeC, partial [Anaerolineae bacterium]